MKNDSVIYELDAKQELCTKLQQRVVDLETTKTTQALEINNLKRRVKKLERRKRSRTHGHTRLYKLGLSARVESSKDEGLGEEDASKQGKIDDIDANKDIYLVNVHKDKYMFGVNDSDGDEVIVKDEKMLCDIADDLDGDEVIVERVDVVDQAKEAIDDITLAKALMEIKSVKPKALKVKDKGKGKMVELELMKKLSKKDQLMLNEELAFKQQAKE
nr:hypothetical protein [Tanacetum cinerariifolium]